MKKNNYILCGKIGRPVGVKGELAVFWHNLETPVALGGKIYLQDGGGHKALTVLHSRVHAGRAIIRFAEVNDREAAQKLTNQDLWLPESELKPLAANEYYSYQLLGMQVCDETGKNLGELINIFSTGSNDVYEILPVGKKTGEELAIPATSDVIQKIDLDKKCMTIRILPGLFMEEEI